jgi:hypothetical protein
MNKLIFPALLLIITCNLFSQEIHLSADNLYFPIWQSSNQITLSNIGTSSLIIDSIYSKNRLGYNLDIYLKDTSIFYIVFIGNPPILFSIDPGDSAQLVFSRPFCPICKSNADFYDTVIVHSNSITNAYAHIYVEGDGSTLVENSNTLVNNYMLFQNYPNPFNPVTSIPFYLAHEDYLTLNVYNNLGQRISCIYSGRLGPGNHAKIWDASEFPSGIYYYKLETASFTAIRKMVLVK